jgi:LysM repeat protein
MAQKFNLELVLSINGKIIDTTEKVVEFAQAHGKENVCEHVPCMKCVEITNDFKGLETESGDILWICEDGTFISEDGLHYSIDAFI